MKRPPFTLEQLRTFLAVAELEHVTQAAASLDLTQGAVTQQVRLLEKALGVKLLERVGRNVRLSDAGRTVATACRVAQRAVERVVEAAELAAVGEIGSVHLGASPTAATHYIDRPLGAYVADRPRVRIQVSVAPTARICEEVALGILDCGVVEEPLPPSQLRRVKLADDEVVLVARPDHPLALRCRLTQRDLGGHRFLARGPGAALEAVGRQMVGSAVELVSQLELGSLDAVRSAATAGLGFAALPLVAVAAEIADGRLSRLDFRPHRRSIYAVRRPAEASPSVESFWRLLIGDPQEAPL